MSDIKITLFFLIFAMFYNYCSSEEKEIIALKVKKEIKVGYKEKVNFIYSKIVKEVFLDEYGALLEDSETTLEINILYVLEILEIDKYNKPLLVKIIFEKSNLKECGHFVRYPLILGVPYLIDLSEEGKVNTTLNEKKVVNMVFNKFRLPRFTKDNIVKDVQLGVDVELDLKNSKVYETEKDYHIVGQKEWVKIDKINGNDNIKKNKSCFSFQESKVLKYEMNNDIKKKLKFDDAIFQINSIQISDIDNSKGILKRFYSQYIRVDKFDGGFSAVHKAVGNLTKETKESVENIYTEIVN